MTCSWDWTCHLQMISLRTTFQTNSYICCYMCSGHFSENFQDINQMLPSTQAVFVTTNWYDFLKLISYFIFFTNEIQEALSCKRAVTHLLTCYLTNHPSKTREISKKIKDELKRWVPLWTQSHGQTSDGRPAEVYIHRLC